MESDHNQPGSQSPASGNTEARTVPPVVPTSDAKSSTQPNIEIPNHDIDSLPAIETEQAPGQDEQMPEVKLQLQEEITIDVWFRDLEVHDKNEGATIVDPQSVERYFWTDPITTIKREIWRPGDGDGDRLTDYYDRPGPTLPLHQRWKLYQSRTGPGPIQVGKNEPPKYVILDDRAAREVLASDFPRTHITRFWPHDFGGNGSIRARRPHRGRGAIAPDGGLEAKGRDRFAFAMIANKKDGERYYFTGEAGYNPVIWSSEDYRLMIGVFKPEIKKLPTPPPKNQLKWNQHGHNQFTPKDQLVKFGAPRKGISYLRYKEKTRDADGNIRGGRNRVQPLPAVTGQADAKSRDTSLSNSPAGSKRRKLGSRSRSRGSASRSGEADDDEDGDEGQGTKAYVEKLERCIVDLKEITDEQKEVIEKQKGQIEELERKLFEAKRKIRVLEAEVSRLKQD